MVVTQRRTLYAERNNGDYEIQIPDDCRPSGAGEQVIAVLRDSEEPTNNFLVD